MLVKAAIVLLLNYAELTITIGAPTWKFLWKFLWITRTNTCRREYYLASTRKMTESQHDTNPTNALTVEKWAEKFFGQYDDMNQELKELFDDTVHGVQAVYNPKSCVQCALRPSFFDLADYRPPTTNLSNRNCAALFQNVTTSQHKEDRLVRCLRQLHKIAKSIGLLSQFPKQNQTQRKLAHEILRRNSEVQIQECCSQAFHKIRVLHEIVQTLWAKRLADTVSLTTNDTVTTPFPAVFGRTIHHLPLLTRNLMALINAMTFADQSVHRMVIC